MQKNLSSLKEIRNTLQQKSFKILLIGDSCYDYYHYGEVNRISPEAPIPIFDLVKTEVKRGMASNVYDNLMTISKQTVQFYTEFREKKNRYIDIKTGQQLLRVDEKLNPQWEEHIQFDLIDWNSIDAIVISDYDKGYLNYDHIKCVEDRAKCPIFIDTKKKDLSKFKNMIVKINNNEYEKSTKDDIENLIITRGPNKVSWKNQFFYPPMVNSFDVCGAGDTFLAGLVLGYLASNDIPKAIEFAMKASSITVQHIGVYSPKMKEIIE